MANAATVSLKDRLAQHRADTIALTQAAMDNTKTLYQALQVKSRNIHLPVYERLEADQRVADLRDEWLRMRDFRDSL